MTTAAASSAESEIDLLLAQFEPRRFTRLSRRELVAEFALAALFAGACAAVAVTVDSRTEWSTPLALALVVALAAARRVQFQAGAGFTTPSQLIFVPMLFAVPLEAVPALVVAGNAIGGAPEYLRRQRPPHKLILNLNDAWYVFGPVVVLAAAGAQTPDWGDWPVYVAALAAQWAVDLGAGAAREWVALGARPGAMLLRVLPWIWLIDALLSPAGLLAAFAGEYAFLLLLPLPLALSVFATERQRRLAQEIELRTARADLERRDLLRREALEINDSVVQHLAVAHYLLARGEVEQAGELVERSLTEGKRIIGDLLEDPEPGTLRRREAAG
jgi:hypothetical protein